MLVQGSTREHDKIFIACRNMDTSNGTMFRGHLVEWDINPANNVGVDIIFQEGSLGNTKVAGVVHDRQIKVGDYGLIQIYGYHDAVFCEASMLGVQSLKASAIFGIAVSGLAGDDPSSRIGISLADSIAIPGGFKVEAILKMMG